MLLVARGNHIEGMKKVLNWLTEGDLTPQYVLLGTTLIRATLKSWLGAHVREE